MPVIPVQAILTRVREVLTAGAGDVRPVVGRFLGDLPVGLSPDAEAMRAIQSARVEATVRALRPAMHTPIVPGKLAYEIDIEVRAVRAVETLHHVSSSARDELSGAAAEDADAIRQALEWPGNLDATELGAQTGLASGLLVHRESSYLTTPPIDSDAAQVVTGLHLFRGVVYVQAEAA